MLVGIVVEEGRTVFNSFFKITIRKQSGFNQGLETITDADDEAASFNKAVNCLANLLIEQNVNNKLGRTIWFIGGREATGKEDDISLVNLSTMVSTEASIAAASKVTKGTNSTWAPAASKALAESYSELVPGKTGM